MMPFARFWDPPPGGLALSSDDVHIWRASLDQPTSQFQRLAQTLSADELARAERFYFEQDRKRFIVGRGILRTLPGHDLGIEPSRLQLFCFREVIDWMGVYSAGPVCRQAFLKW